MEINVDEEFDATWKNCLETHTPKCEHTEEELNRSGSLLIRIEKFMGDRAIVRIYFVRESGERIYYAQHSIPMDIIRTYFKPASTAPSATYPHKCPRCNRPAYVGFSSIQCSNSDCV